MINLKPGWVNRIIRGEVVEPIEMFFCVNCGLYHTEGDHAKCVVNMVPVEPEVIEKETKIVGLLTY